MLVHGPKLKIYLDLNCLVMFVDPLYILVSQSKMKEDKKIKDNTNKRTNKYGILRNCHSFRMQIACYGDLGKQKPANRMPTTLAFHLVEVESGKLQFSNFLLLLVLATK